MSVVRGGILLGTGIGDGRDRVGIMRDMSIELIDEEADHEIDAQVEGIETDLTLESMIDAEIMIEEGPKKETIGMTGEGPDQGTEKDKL